MSDLVGFLDTVSEVTTRRSQNLILHTGLYPDGHEGFYPRQFDFFKAGLTEFDRLLMAGNQSGKTRTAGFEVACHLTGLYPSWWPGFRFNRPVAVWCCGVTGEVTRDTAQRYLFGNPNIEGDIGTHFVPMDRIGKYTSMGNPGGAMEFCTVRHVSGGMSRVGFKGYSQGREKFQGETLDLIWFDEEPPQDIYSEGVTRTGATNGLVVLSFTPLKGVSEVVRSYTKNGQGHITKLTIDDVLDDNHRNSLLRLQNTWPEHERPARLYAEPKLGSGAIYPFQRSRLSVPAFDIPKSWPCICSIDFGWDHPFAAVKMALDPDNDVLYVTNAHKGSRIETALQIEAVKGWGVDTWCPLAYPHDGEHERSGGDQKVKPFKEAGLNVRKDCASWSDTVRDITVQPGLQEIYDRMATGKFKVFSHLEDWFDEQQVYCREDGKIKKVWDDLMDATRTGVMDLRFAKSQISYESRKRPKQVRPVGPTPTRRVLYGNSEHSIHSHAPSRGRGGR